MSRKKQKTEYNRGSLTVEALLFLIPFIIAFCTIINAARFVQAEVIIHHAITQTAKQISTYSYVLTKAGITQKMQESNGKSKRFQATVDDAMSSIEGLADAAGEPSALAEGVFSLVKSESRKEAMGSIAGALAEETIRDSIGLMSDDPDEFLSNLGIEGGLSGLDFSDSDWVSNGPDEKANIVIVVKYSMKNVLFPDFEFAHSYEFCQSASTSIW